MNNQAKTLYAGPHMSWMWGYLKNKFNVATLNRLAKHGIRIIDVQGSDAFVSYCLDDRGTGRALSYLDVLALAQGLK